MKKIKWLIPIALFAISLVILLRPAGRITFDKSVSENRILLQYETFGCGSIIRKVLDGGEEITSGYISDYPDIGTNEVVFAKGTGEPLDDMGPYSMGGYGTGYVFVVEGTPIGVTRGASECCDPKPAYNETVVELKVDKWYFTSYVPFIAVGDVGVVLIGCLIFIISVIISVIFLVISGLIKLYGHIKNRNVGI